MNTDPPAPSREPLERAGIVSPGPRGAVTVIFFAFGIGMGLWAGSVAAILARSEMGPEPFGVALTLFSAAYLLAMSTAGHAARRYGSRLILLVALPLMALSLAAVLSAQSPTWLFLALIFYGFFAGAVDLTMNVEGSRIERRLGRPIMSGFHAFVSAGVGIGAVAGSLIAASSLPESAVAIEGVFLLLAAAAAQRWIVPEAETAALRAGQKPRALFGPSLILLGLIIGLAVACETGISTWSTVLLKNAAPKLVRYSGLGAAVFSICQSLLRLNGDRLRGAFDDFTLIIASMAIAIVGVFVLVADFSFAADVVGFAIVGVGMGVVAPCAFAMAASQPGIPPGAGLSSASMFSAVARLPAPIVMGALAARLPLSLAFLFYVAMLITGIGATLAFARTQS